MLFELESRSDQVVRPHSTQVADEILDARSIKLVELKNKGERKGVSHNGHVYNFFHM